VHLPGDLLSYVDFPPFTLNTLQEDWGILQWRLTNLYSLPREEAPRLIPTNELQMKIQLYWEPNEKMQALHLEADMASGGNLAYLLGLSWLPQRSLCLQYYLNINTRRNRSIPGSETWYSWSRMAWAQQVCL
jgi:hypothetical protein